MRPAQAYERGDALTAAKRQYRYIVEQFYGRTVARGDLIRCPGEHAGGDRNPSLHLVGETGSRCFSCGFRGTVVDFIMRAEGISRRQACLRAIELAGMAPVAPPPISAPQASVKRPPLLKGRGEPPFFPACATDEYVYRDRDGAALVRVYRIDRPGRRKQFLQMTWDGSRWVVGLQGCGPRPIFRLDVLTLNPDRPVLICEGEKAAIAAQRIFTDHVAVTSLGGCCAAEATDWLPLKGRRVTLWPDNDRAGLAYAIEVCRILRSTSTSVRVVRPGPMLPVGWDLADQLPAGVSPDVLRQLLADAQPMPPGIL